ncbi:RNA methyltransferase tRNA(m5U54)methyltransferase [Marasmius crinis-equi]|uniref:tRNA (guanine(26)-N(2))-dimethyltransferase n=1 Tax=Marasmius crinis-equi TaxID=585013 RepID=A0ABR3G1I9_9AGAR
MSTESSISVPEGFKLYTENTSHILLSSNEAFLNPVQEFNRDLSVACINVWSEEINRSKQEKWNQAQEKKAGKAKKDEERARKRQKVQKETEPGSTDGVSVTAPEDVKESVGSQLATQPESIASEQKESEQPQCRPYNAVILEALSATGLRSIRYAKEIPLVKFVPVLPSMQTNTQSASRYVIANDLSSAATAAMKRNIESNGLAPETDSKDADSQKRKPLGKIRINEGDACALMYNHRQEHERVDVVDLDPYGTAAPFIDAAVQCVKDGGLLCVTCTDLSVLATNNYPEKCLSNYGGVPVKAEYCHEAALRLVLHTVSTSASRYGRYIEPLLSLSIDFYVRLFIRVNTSPIQVKRALTKTSTYYICTSCQAFYEQPLGRVIEKKSERTGDVNYIFKTQPGPTVEGKCPECESVLHIAGPMWSGPIHDTDFVSKVLEHTENKANQYGTASRMKGMLTVAKEELHTPFYFTPSKTAGFFHCTTPSLDETASALLHAGHKISRSHACPGSLKTTATRSELYDVFRSWVKAHPINTKKISERSPALRLLAKEPKSEANFKHHPDSVTASSHVKVVRYQENPAHWGPGTRAVAGTSKPSKRKRNEEE